MSNSINLCEQHLLYQISSKLEKKYSIMGKVSCTPLRTVWLSWTVLHGSHNSSLTLFGDPPYRNSRKSAQKYGKWETNSYTPLRKVWLSLDRFSWNSCCRKRLLKHLHTDFIKRELRSSGSLFSVNVNSTPTFRTLEGGTYRLSLNVSTELPIYAA